MQIYFLLLAVMVGAVMMVVVMMRVVIRDGNKLVTRGYPTHPVYVIEYRIGFFLTEMGFNRVLNGSGFIEKPKSDLNY